MFSYCCSKPDTGVVCRSLSKGQPQIENVLEKDVDNLRVRIDDMKKQINNIYELLEALTNESKKKTSFILDKSNLDKNNLNEINA